MTKCRSCSSIWLASVSNPSSPKVYLGCRTKITLNPLPTTATFLLDACCCLKLALLEVEVLRLNHLCSFHIFFKHSTFPCYSPSFGLCCYLNLVVDWFLLSVSKLLFCNLINFNWDLPVISWLDSVDPCEMECCSFFHSCHQIDTNKCITVPEAFSAESQNLKSKMQGISFHFFFFFISVCGPFIFPFLLCLCLCHQLLSDFVIVPSSLVLSIPSLCVISSSQALVLLFSVSQHH